MSPFKRTQILPDPINITRVAILKPSTERIRRNFLPNPIFIDTDSIIDHIRSVLGLHFKTDSNQETR